jgi:hypothetical protein
LLAVEYKLEKGKSINRAKEASLIIAAVLAAQF